jgi:hypothetical protein
MPASAVKNALQGVTLHICHQNLAFFIGKPGEKGTNLTLPGLEETSGVNVLPIDQDPGGFQR